MRILHVINGLHQGGAESVLERLVCADRSNHHSIVSLYKEGPLGRRLRDEGFEIHNLDIGRGRLPSPRAIARLWSIIRATRPDILQCWMYHSNLLGGAMAKAAGVRRICWNIRRTGIDAGLSARTRLVARIGARLSSIIPDRTIYCAYSAASRHVAHGYDRGSATVIQNGIDTRRFSIDPAAGLAVRQELGIEPGEALIGLVARFHRDKGHRTFFEALGCLGEAHPRPRCLLVGPGVGTSDQAVVELAERYGVADRLICLGPRDDLPAIMNAIDFYVSPSLTEGFPNVVAEAMACGTPCIATDVGDSRLILGECGWIVPPQAPEMLADAIEKALALRSTDRWPAVRQAARRRCVAHFGMDRMVGAYRELWSKVAGADQANAR